MATSQSPDSAPSAVLPPPRSSSSLPDHLSLTPSSPPPHLSHSQSNSPTTTNVHVTDTVPSMAPSGSPSTNSTSPAASPPPPSEQPAASPPPPSTTSPPPVSASPPPKNDTPPPATNSPPPPLPDPPEISPPPPTTPIYSPSPVSENPPVVTPTTPSPNPPATSPPPASSSPPSTSPPPLSADSDPPQFSPPPADGPPQNSPSSPSSQPPQTPTSPLDSGSPPEDSASSPGSEPPTNSTTPPSTFTPPPPLSPDSQPSPNSSATPIIPVSSPPPGVSPPSPTQFQVPPSSILTHNSNAPSRNGTVSTGVAVGIGVVLGFILLGAIGVAAWCTSKRRKRVTGMPTSLSSPPNKDSSLLKAQRSPAGTASRSASEYQYSPSEGGGIGNSRPWFTYEALVEATNGFSEENLLGEGGFGRVYKGHLPDGQEVAVKQLKIGGGQGEREFKAEVDIISRIHHRHLVSLAGYCISDSRRLLVYEYVPNNTLHFHLHGTDMPVMTWERRVKIAAGAARGIAYLHEDCLPRIIHRDIKSANILLDKNFEARVSDFGLAKLAADANSHVTTRVMGTFGYMAPEYASSGKLTEKSDVFSFGVVLLELITGRKPVDTSQPLGQESLAEWARPKLSHALTTEEFQDLVDPRLEKNYVDSEMFRAIEAAASCVRHSVAKRPTMGQVVRAFESMISADLTNGMRVGESAIYSSAEQSAEMKLFRRMAFGQGSQDFSMDTFSQGSWNNERTSGASMRETS